MPWFRVETGIFRHPKIVAVGPAGLLLYLRSIAYAADHATDGRIPKAVVPTLYAEVEDCRRSVAALSPGNGVTGSVTALPEEAGEPDEKKEKRSRDRRRQRLVRRLVESGLWVEIADRYEVHDYLDYQPTAAEVKDAKERARALTRDRVRRHREKKKAGGLSPIGRNPDDVTPPTIRPTPTGVGSIGGKTPPNPSRGSASTSLPATENDPAESVEEIRSLVDRLRAGQRL
jgi:hypothetical protein